ncbi:unnamed protein product [marine sediment metagenome]|uniref:Putative mRNA interferase YoeB n=1 Tax=marine sediment metagenome TaxID=412755 RepID=X0XDR3_9ZZZZ
MRNIVFDPDAIEDLVYWVGVDQKRAQKILDLILEAAENPFKGRGKPEPLKYELAGCWSRRITQEHRLVYEVTDCYIRVLACRYHY